LLSWCGFWQGRSFALQTKIATVVVHVTSEQLSSDHTKGKLHHAELTCSAPQYYNVLYHDTTRISILKQLQFLDGRSQWIMTNVSCLIGGVLRRQEERCLNNLFYSGLL